MPYDDGFLNAGRNSFFLSICLFCESQIPMPFFRRGVDMVDELLLGNPACGQRGVRNRQRVAQRQGPMGSPSRTGISGRSRSRTPTAVGAATTAASLPDTSKTTSRRSRRMSTRLLFNLRAGHVQAVIQNRFRFSRAFLQHHIARFNPR